MKVSRHFRGMIACDANMCSENFEKSLWFQSGQMFVVAFEGSVHMHDKWPEG